MRTAVSIIIRENNTLFDDMSNKIFEFVICDYFIAKDEEKARVRDSGVFQHDVVSGDKFDMG